MRARTQRRRYGRAARERKYAKALRRFLKNMRYSSRRVADGLDVVAIRVEHEGAVIVGVVMRPRSRWAVVASARGQRRAIERVDDRARIGTKCNVHAGSIWRSLADPEVGLRRHAEPGDLLELHEDAVAERRERGPIDRLGLGNVGHADAGMVDHRNLPTYSRARTPDTRAAPSAHACDSRPRPRPHFAARRSRRHRLPRRDALAGSA